MRRHRHSQRSGAAAEPERLVPGEPAPVPRWAVLLIARLSAAWGLLAALSLAVALLGRGMTGASAAPVGDVLTAIAWELVVLALLVGFLGTPLTALADLVANDKRTSVRWLGAIAVLAAAWLAALAYVSSWGLYWSTGVFAGRDAIVFWLEQPVQMLHWVYPPLLLTVLAGSTALTAAVAACIRTLQGVAPSTHRRISGVAAVSIGVCLAVSSSGAPTQTRSGSSSTIRITAIGGPAASLLHDLIRAPSATAAPGSGSASVTGPLRIVRRPMLPTAEYLASLPSGRRRWNVVMVQIESLRCDQLRAYGAGRDVMPAVNQLAMESRVFTQAYVQASHSNYADLVALSSQYPLRSEDPYDYPRNPLYPRVLIYDVLKALGYRTGIFSSQNEHWGSMSNYHRPENLDRFFHAATFDGPTYTPWEDMGFASWVSQTGAAGSVDDRYTVDEAIRWLDTLGDQPFFLHLNLQSSHVPYVVPRHFRRPFGRDDLGFAIAWGRFPRDQVAAVKDRYADSLYYADTQIARVFEYLRARGHWDRTVIVIGGDNGEAFFEHGFAAHASWVFDEVVRVPMIVRAPGLTPGQDDRPAMFLDAPPTVLDLLGMPPHPGFQGTSLLQRDVNPLRPLFTIVQTPSARATAIVRGGLKLHFIEKEGAYSLFDLAQDPGETRDIAAHRTDLVEPLKVRLHQWRDEQLAYYRDAARQQREYPPAFEEP